MYCTRQRWHHKGLYRLILINLILTDTQQQNKLRESANSGLAYPPPPLPPHTHTQPKFLFLNQNICCWSSMRGVLLSLVKIINFLILNQNICYGYSKEPSQWDGSFEHPKHMLKLMGKKLFANKCLKFCLSKPMKITRKWHQTSLCSVFSKLYNHCHIVVLNSYFLILRIRGRPDVFMILMLQIWQSFENW